MVDLVRSRIDIVEFASQRQERSKATAKSDKTVEGLFDRSEKYRLTLVERKNRR